MSIPSHTKVLVIGGGPAGAYTASVLARENVEVIVFEAAQFPRYHVGESLLPSVHDFFKFIGADEKLRECKFTNKPGAAVKLTEHAEETYCDFGALPSENAVRSDLDELLLRHAAESGAMVFEQTRVTNILFEQGRNPANSEDSRPIAVKYTTKDGATENIITFDYLVDASGKNGLMSTKYLKNRQMNKTLRNIACWGYWRNAGQYMPNTERHNAPWFEGLTDESGWVWFLPLHDGTVSVGFVINGDITSSKKSALRERDPLGYSLEAYYLDQLQYAPRLQDLLKEATLVVGDGDHGLKSASDYSYAAKFYAGDHYRLVGDAAAFLDPLFSTGVHLAHNSGLSAAVSIVASIKKQCTEEEAIKYHNLRVSSAYTRSMLLVLSTYRKIKNQKRKTNSIVDEDNYIGRLFQQFRPVLVGSVEIGPEVPQEALENAVKFASDVLFLGDSEIRKCIDADIEFDLLMASTPINGLLKNITLRSDGNVAQEEADISDMEKTALRHAFQTITNSDFGNLKAHLERGSLGLVSTES